MKNIYLFEYQFKQEKRGLMNYKTYMIVDFERPDSTDEDGKIVKYIPREEAVKQFIEKFPHVDMKTVQISLFHGSIIDSCEPAAV